jgi:hypothetical protein
MRFKLLALVLLGIGFCPASDARANTNPETLARLAVSENSSESVAAIDELRAMGPEGLRILFKAYDAEINRQTRDLEATSARSPQWQRLSAALDAVSQQRDSYLSRLYWYTDIEQAKAAARASGKPILSLRLLGLLTDEFSCANSRFFRTALYSNSQVSAYLREHFILHWKSVRPVPRVTIDFGDGRKLERTLTGNSIHYILDVDGHPVDALPGLYGPAAFLREIARSETLARECAGQSNEKRREILRLYHKARLDAVAAQWLADTKRTGGKIPEVIAAREASGKNPPRAAAVAPLAVTKRVTEIDIIAAMSPDAKALGEVTDEAAWNRIAALYLADARLDANSLALIRRQISSVVKSAGPNTDKAASDEQFSRLVQSFERNMALDTVRNEYMMRTKIRAWLGTWPEFYEDVETLNETVYAQLFLTPSADPWLGLYSPDTYTALENGGVRQ